MIYEELAGGIGRSVYFRAKRHPARLALKGIASTVVLGDVASSLQDFSMTGLAVRVGELKPNLVPGVIVPISVRLNDFETFSGRAQVVRSETVGRWTTIGVKLVDKLLDASEVQNARNRIIVRDAVANGIGQFSSVAPAYRDFCGEATFFLSYWRSTLERLDSASGESIDFTRLEFEAEQRMREEWSVLRMRGNDLTSALCEGDDVYAATKRYTEIQFTPLTVDAPIWKRAYEKPRGYPGDFVLMTYMYDDARMGDTVFGRILHQIGREERLAATVPSRKQLIKELIGGVVRTHDHESSSGVKVLSIGAGPARELEEYIESDDSTTPLVITLIDQDEDALAYACERLRKVVLYRGRLVDVRARYIAFGQLLGRRDLLVELRGQDVIYSAGLMDYLSDGAAQGLLSLCYELAAPGSLLAFGNASFANDVRWVPEFVLDWHMVYRTEVEIRRLVRLLPRDADVSVRRDASGAWCFLVIRKACSSA